MNTFNDKTIKCPCGKKISIPLYLVKRKKYCSKKCLYKYRKRPKGLKYTLLVDNKSWFKNGHTSWNKGTKGLCKVNSSSITKGQHLSIKTEFQKGQMAEEKNYNWKGNFVGYDALHGWLKRKVGSAKKCSSCGNIKNVQWANKSYEYKRDINDWFELCSKCHHKYDRQNNWGIATRLFNLNKRKHD